MVSYDKVPMRNKLTTTLRRGGLKGDPKRVKFIRTPSWFDLCPIATSRIS
jgi:hypothetical protein